MPLALPRSAYGNHVTMDRSSGLGGGHVPPGPSLDPPMVTYFCIANASFIDLLFLRCMIVTIQSPVQNNGWRSKLRMPASSQPLIYNQLNEVGTSGRTAV